VPSPVSSRCSPSEVFQICGNVVRLSLFLLRPILSSCTIGTARPPPPRRGSGTSGPSTRPPQRPARAVPRGHRATGHTLSRPSANAAGNKNAEGSGANAYLPIISARTAQWLPRPVWRTWHHPPRRSRISVKPGSHCLRIARFLCPFRRGTKVLDLDRPWDPMILSDRTEHEPWRLSYRHHTRSAARCTRIRA
jgi:hypothetical protein